MGLPSPSAVLQWFQLSLVKPRNHAAEDEVLSPGLIIYAAETLHHLFATEMVLSCAVHRLLPKRARILLLEG